MTWFILAVVSTFLGSLLLGAAFEGILSPIQLRLFGSGLTLFGIGIILIVEHIRS